MKTCGSRPADACLNASAGLLLLPSPLQDFNEARLPNRWGVGGGISSTRMQAEVLYWVFKLL